MGWRWQEVGGAEETGKPLQVRAGSPPEGEIGGIPRSAVWNAAARPKLKKKATYSSAAKTAISEEEAKKKAIQDAKDAETRKRATK